MINDDNMHYIIFILYAQYNMHYIILYYISSVHYIIFYILFKYNWSRNKFIIFKIINFFVKKRLFYANLIGPKMVTCIYGYKNGYMHKWLHALHAFKNGYMHFMITCIYK
jgi:hypothetical protein